MSEKSKPRKLRDLLEKPGVVMQPCAYDAISARVIEACGFDMVGTSGFCVHGALLGQPDLGLVMYNEMIDHAGRIANAVEIPLLVDGESGYGGALAVMREVEDCERRGVAGILIDDQAFPPNCPWIKDETTISVEEMCGKVAAAKAARRNPDFVILVRSCVKSFEEQVSRCNAYLEAGADVAKINLMTQEQIPLAPKLVKGPLHIGCSFGRGAHAKFSAFQLGDMGYKIVSFIQTSLFLSIKASMEGLKEVRRTGSNKSVEADAITMDEYFKLIDLDRFMALEKRFGIR